MTKPISLTAAMEEARRRVSPVYHYGSWCYNHYSPDRSAWWINDHLGTVYEARAARKEAYAIEAADLYLRSRGHEPVIADLRIADPYGSAREIAQHIIDRLLDQ